MTTNAGPGKTIMAMPIARTSTPAIPIRIFFRDQAAFIGRTHVNLGQGRLFGKMGSIKKARSRKERAVETMTIKSALLLGYTVALAETWIHLVLLLGRSWSLRLLLHCGNCRWVDLEGSSDEGLF